jgi:hypothetical protein
LGSLKPPVIIVLITGPPCAGFSLLRPFCLSVREVVISSDVYQQENTWDMSTGVYRLMQVEVVATHFQFGLETFVDILWVCS